MLILRKPRVHVALTNPLHQFVREEAGRAGMSQSEYIKHLVMQKFEERLRESFHYPVPADDVPKMRFDEHV